MVFVVIVPLEVLRTFFVVEYTTPDLLMDLGVAELKIRYWIGGRIRVRLNGGCRIWIDWVYLVVGRYTRRRVLECSSVDIFWYFRQITRRNRGNITRGDIGVISDGNCRSNT